MSECTRSLVRQIKAKGMADELTDHDKMPKACPFCGKESGYVYSYVERRTQWFGFDGEAIDNADGPILSVTKRRCIECRRLLPKEFQEGDGK